MYGATRVKVKFESGESVEADLVIGADGINSRVASYILGTQPSISKLHRT
jgi:2-polyprenyl-6-methoxyphenol hydroxylase-like FAD-dependent oxidoreductase